MNAKTTLLKGFGTLTTIGLIGLFLGLSAVPATQVNAAGVLPVSVAITASPSTVCAGQSTQITWSSTDATSISIDQGIGSVMPFGNRYVSPNQTTTYTITGTNATGGFGVASATVFVAGTACQTPIPTPTPIYQIYGGLTCAPSVQSVMSGQQVTFSGYYTTAPNYQAQQLSWTAVGGTPSTGSGYNFSTQFYTGSVNQTNIVSVSDGYQSATCSVYVNGNQYYYPTPTPYYYPTPTPYYNYQTLQCSPLNTSANSGDLVNFSATGGNGSYSWTTTDGIPSTGYGSIFSTRFYGTSQYQYSYPYSTTHTVTVNSAGQSSTCTVTVAPSQLYPTPTPYYYYPTPTPYFYSQVSVDHTVRNLTRGGAEATSVTAYNGDRLQFIERITTGNQYAQDVHVRDWLPQNVSYAYGSTTLDGVYYQDGIATGANNDSLALGNLLPNRTYVVRFEATINGAPNGTLINTINTHVSGVSPDQTRSSTVTVVGSYVTPTPYYYYPTPTPYYYTTGNSQLIATIAGRNISRGQTREYSAVSAQGNDTVGVIVHVNSANGQPVTNAMVTSALPAGLQYVSGSTTLNGFQVADGVTSSGISLGTIQPGQQSTLRYSVIVDPAYVPFVGSTIFRDSVQIRSDNQPTIILSLPVTVSRIAPLASVSNVQTGPADSVILALAAALVATGFYAAYTQTNAFSRRQAVGEIARIAGTTPNFLR